MGKSRDDARRQAERDLVFPPRPMTGREHAAAMVAGHKPATDWRPALAERFGIDGDRTPSELDGVDPGEPDRYDISDIQYVHALMHMPLWLIGADEVKLLLHYGYGSSSIFRLALLMIEADPLQVVEGAAFGPLLPSAAASVRWDYDPVRDTAALHDEEARFRASALDPVLKRMEDGEIRQAARAALGRPRRFARTEASVPVRRRPDGSVEVVSRISPDAADQGSPQRLTFYLAGHADAADLWAIAVDQNGRVIADRAAFLPSGVGEAKAMMQGLFGIGLETWSDFDAV
jgi:hypothetical protein